MIDITCEDCMKLMARYPAKYFDLAICDPPYGIGQTWKKNSGGKIFQDTSYRNEERMGPEYFDELRRVSKEQIIFGYNYYVDIFGPTHYLIIWNKKVSGGFNKYCQAEIAYTSFRVPVQVFNVPWDGACRGTETHITKIHPHQKPVDLYKEILDKYATPGQLILDTHLGSGASAIACYDSGFNMVGCEIDPIYFQMAQDRVGRHINAGGKYVC